MVKKEILNMVKNALVEAGIKEFDKINIIAQDESKNGVLVKVYTSKGPLMYIDSQLDWQKKGVPFYEFFSPKDRRKKVCFRRGRSGAYDYNWKEFRLHISMAGKAYGLLPWNVGEQILYEYVNDHGPTGLITQSRKVCTA